MTWNDSAFTGSVGTGRIPDEPVVDRAIGITATITKAEELGRIVRW